VVLQLNLCRVEIRNYTENQLLGRRTEGSSPSHLEHRCLVQKVVDKLTIENPKVLARVEYEDCPDGYSSSLVGL